MGVDFVATCEVESCARRFVAANDKTIRTAVRIAVMMGLPG
jgi:hypothetical protein